MTNWRKLAAMVSLCVALPTVVMAAEKVVTATRPDVSFKNEVETAIGKGLNYLATQQKPGGWWSQEEHPALTALALTCFNGDPTGYYRKKYEEGIAKGYSYLLKNVKPDGAIYGKDVYINYNTAVSMMALLTSRNTAYDPLLKKARRYLIDSQHNQGGPEMGDSPYDGGIGYGRTDKNPDLSNTVLALEALYYTRFLKSDVANDPEAKDLNWKAAAQFISRTQHLPGYNDQKWASDDEYNKGGFAYFPGNSRAGEMQTKDGKTTLRAYGSMSYAGLLSYIYAQMDKQDPRVQSAYDWLVRNYTVNENPGFDQNGMYYYLHTMTKALTLYGAKTIPLKNGRKADWRQDVGSRLMDLQRVDGSWMNEKSGRWWENDPILVTTYAVMALEMIYRGL